MTEQQNSGTFPSQPHFTGPRDDEHLAGWQGLRRQMSGGRDNGQYIIPHMNLLDELAFGSTPLSDIVSGIPGGAEGYKTAKRTVEAVAAELSSMQLSDAQFRPLHKSLVTGLTARWVALRDTNEWKDKGLDQESTGVLRLPHVAMLYGVIRMIQHETIKMHVGLVAKQLKVPPSSDRHERIEVAANRLFNSSLMTYENTTGVHFTSFVIGAFRRFLLLSSTRQNKADRDPDSVVHELSLAASALAHSPIEQLQAAEEQQAEMGKLQSALLTLSERDRMLAEELFGLAGKPSKSLAEIAKDRGITKQGVGHHRSRLVRVLRDALGEGEKER